MLAMTQRLTGWAATLSNTTTRPPRSPVAKCCPVPSNSTADMMSAAMQRQPQGFEGLLEPAGQGSKNHITGWGLIKVSLENLKLLQAMNSCCHSCAVWSAAADREASKTCLPGSLRPEFVLQSIEETPTPNAR